MDPITLDEDRALRPFVGSDLDELHALIEANREHLLSWMPWAAQPRADTAGFLARAEERAAREEGAAFAVIEGGRIAGGIGLNGFDRLNGSASIGYWLAAGAQGRGTITLGVAAVLDFAFETYGLHRIEISVATGNARSFAIVRRLGFVEEGVRREALRVGDRYLDLVMHSTLADEWRARRG
jgi:RimJ/RimL family protein N-acetyltransferase